MGTQPFREPSASADAGGHPSSDAGSLASVLHGIRDAFLTIDREWQVTFANAAACELIEARQDGLVGRSFWDAFPVASTPEYAARFRRAMDARVPVHFEAHSEATDRWFSKRVFPVSEGIAVIIEDVSERHHADSELLVATKALQRNEALFRSITEHSAEFITIVADDGRVLYASQSGARLLGMGPEELVGRHAAEFVHPDDAPTMLETYRTLRSAPDVAASMRVRLRHRDGSWRLIEGTGRNRIDDPAVRGIVSTARDITAQAAAEAELRMRAHLLDAVEQAVVATDLDGTITYWNRSAQTLYGWPTDTVLGHPAAEAIPVLAARLGDPATLESLRSGMSWSGDFDARRRDGSTFPAHVDCSPIAGPDGTMQGVVSVSSDLTERRMLEEQLRVTQKLEAVGSLAGGIAHDFNNILTAISSYSEMLLGDLIPGDPARHDVGEIHQAAQRAASLTRQLLAFSRHQVLQPRRMRLDETVQGMEGLLRRLVGEDIVLSVEAGHAPMRVLADPGQIEQVLMNLVVNARDAMAHGGALFVGLRSVVVDDGYAPARGMGVDPGSYVVLTVRDTGHGMSPAVRERAFEPFFTTKSTGKGTGLGLATVYGIVRQSQGFITLETVEGRGTTFEVYLPELEEKAECPGEAQAAADAAKRCGTILVVEDEAGVRAVARRVLEREGHTVVLADSGEAGLEILERRGKDFDLVLTDLVMPRMGGREMVDRMRAMGLSPAVLFMSGYTEDEIARREVGNGSGWLEKPFTIHGLRSRIQVVLGAVLAARA